VVDACGRQRLESASGSPPLGDSFITHQAPARTMRPHRPGLAHGPSRGDLLWSGRPQERRQLGRPWIAESLGKFRRTPNRAPGRRRPDEHSNGSIQMREP